ncbi:MAG TPA: hypothetical protein VJZ76_08160 [Thermoanaerobaculia bacterium]|nr:hypothetical protein [Thermoanaerobaculia bacterium]
MQAEIVFTGLCSILNPDGTNKEMGDPGVILVQTPGHDHEHDHEHEAPEHHFAYLAFDSTAVEVTGTNVPALKPVLMAEPFVYMDLDGVELSLIEEPLEAPIVDDSYRNLVAHRDEYWPEAIGRFDHDLVPPKGSRPKKSVVKAWVRFDGGRLGASRLSKVPWRFEKGDGSVLEKCFAEEVIYDGFDHAPDAVVLKRKDLEDEKIDLGDLRFSLKPQAGTSTITLIIGNNIEKDMAGSVFREETKLVADPRSQHFKFLNRTAGPSVTGPIPQAINPPSQGQQGGGGSGGACGPGSGDGGGKPAGGGT